MPNKLKIFFLVVGSFLLKDLKAQQVRFDSKYESTKSNQSMVLLLNSDSTYNYEERNHMGGIWKDNGTWKLYCDLLILNSDKTMYVNSKEKKAKSKSICPIFDNSCFKVISRDSLLYDKGYSLFFLVKSSSTP